MATPGRLKTRIDLLKKKLADKGPALEPARRRNLQKRLRRAQRARRVALALEARAEAKKPKPAAADASGGGEAPAPPAGT